MHTDQLHSCISRNRSDKANKGWEYIKQSQNMCLHHNIRCKRLDRCEPGHRSESSRYLSEAVGSGDKQHSGGAETKLDCIIIDDDERLYRRKRKEDAGNKSNSEGRE